MGVKDLWSILAPYCERRPIYELQGKTVAIDLAGWVCESLNVVDYFIHPRQYLKNLYFRTCYLLLAGVTPVFVLEGKAPVLKADVISKRNEIQFRGVKPRDPPKYPEEKSKKTATKDRTRFNAVLKKCKELLQCMGVQCVQAPGEAEAFCAFLNKKGFVSGVISQDSDCFAYGAVKVYRNFSVSTQGTANCSGGAVDIYDMEKICESIDFGQNKIITLALLCGCDYCPDGIGGVGKDSVLKLFNKYKNTEILDRIREWRDNDHKYTTLELRVDDKNICVNCGHIGKLYNHTKRGCVSCQKSIGCDESLWKEQRLSIKSELILRRKAIMNPDFPSQEIINEFINEPKVLPVLDLQWKQPNLVKLVRTFGKLLQWTEIYCFQKCLPLLARWQVFTFATGTQKSLLGGSLQPRAIKKKRVLKGIASYEVIWTDEQKSFEGLIPEEQMKLFLDEGTKAEEALWTSVEPIDLLEKAYPKLVEQYNLSTQKKTKKVAKKREHNNKTSWNFKKKKDNSLKDMSGLLAATKEIEQGLSKKISAKNKIPSIKNFFICMTPPNKKTNFAMINCSTPKIANNLSDLEDDVGDFDYSNIIKGIISKPAPITKYVGKRLAYEKVEYSNSILSRSQDDLDLMVKRRNSISLLYSEKSIKQRSWDSLSGAINESIADISFHNYCNNSMKIESVVDRFLKREGQKEKNEVPENRRLSFFFGSCSEEADEFEKSLAMDLEIPSILSRSSDEEL